MVIYSIQQVKGKSFLNKENNNAQSVLQSTSPIILDLVHNLDFAMEILKSYIKGQQEDETFFIKKHENISDIFT